MFFDWIAREGGAVLGWWLLTLLADAVFFLGVGMKTARGMGLCRRIDD